jgi:hypothetical protein
MPGRQPPPTVTGSPGWYIPVSVPVVPPGAPLTRRYDSGSPLGPQLTGDTLVPYCTSSAEIICPLPM